MGIRFKKSINYGPMRVNFSKSGIGGSIGGKGCRLTKTANGRTRSTLSIPGTGLSYVSENGKGQKSKDQVIADKRQSNFDVCYWLCFFSWLPLILMGLLLCCATWTGLIFIPIGIIEWGFIHKVRKIRKENGNG